MDTSLPPIWYASKRVLRTIVQALVVLIPVVNGVGLAVVGYLREQTDIAIPDSVFLVLNAIVAGTALLMGLAARVMAVAGVNDVLAHVGLGSVPAARIADGIVLPDPKVATRAEYQAAIDPHNPAVFRDPGAHNQP